MIAPIENEIPEMGEIIEWDLKFALQLNFTLKEGLVGRFDWQHGKNHIG